MATMKDVNKAVKARTGKASVSHAMTSGDAKLRRGALLIQAGKLGHASRASVRAFNSARGKPASGRVTGKQMVRGGKALLKGGAGRDPRTGRWAKTK